MVPEFSIPSEAMKSADDALFANTNVPVVIVETKKLGQQVTEAISSVVKYCSVEGFHYSVVTDGRHRTEYDTLESGEVRQSTKTSDFIA